MKSLPIEKIARFEGLLHAFAGIERVAHVSNRETRENDVEHSFFLAMLAWYLIDAAALLYDKSKVLQYALIHDLVEVYAGDTYIFDTEALKTKQQREHAAATRLEKEFPEFPDLHDTIANYESQKDEESKFVKALDKVEHFIANYIQKGGTWKEMGIKFDELVAHKRAKVAHSPEVTELLEAFIAAIEPRKEEFFPS